MKKLKLLFMACAMLVGQPSMAKIDITATYLQNADLSALDGWSYGDSPNNADKKDGPNTASTYNYQDYKTDGAVNVIEFYHTWSNNQAGQTIPAGVQNFHFTQKVTLPAGYYRLAVNAFYREGNGNGTNADKAYILAGTTKQNIHALTAEEMSALVSITNKSDIYDAAQAFKDGMYLNEFDFHLDTNQEIEIGFKGYINTYCSWCILGPVTLWQYEASDYAEDYNKKLSDAKAAFEDNLYINVTGSEKKALDDAIKFNPSTIDDYINGGKALTDATTAFKAAKDAYDALVKENTKAKRFDLDGYTITEETTAAIAIEKVKEIKVQVFNKVKTDYPTAITLGDWSDSGNTYFNYGGQHWSGNNEGYWEQNNDVCWESANWTVWFEQAIKLPKGKYVFKMKGRHGGGSNEMALIVKDGETEIGTVADFPVGSTGLGVNKNGETSFDATDPAGFANGNNGFGWEWRYVPFTITEEKNITIRIEANATAKYQWISFCDYSVVATADNTFAALIAYNQKIEEAKKAIEEHPDVKGKELAELNALIEATEPSSLEEIKNATTALETAISAYIAAEEGWKRYAIATMTATEAGAEFTDISADNTKTAENAITEANALFTTSINIVKDVNTEGKTLGFDAGEWTLYLIQPSIAYVNTLLTEGGETDAEKVMVADATAMKDAVTAIKGWKANEAEVNAVANGNFANTNIESTGWIKTASWANIRGNGEGNWWSVPSNSQIKYGESDNDAFKLSLKPNTVYYINFKHSKWDEGNKDNGGFVSVLNDKNEGLQRTAYEGTDNSKQEHFIFKTGAEQSNYVLTVEIPSGRGTFSDFEIKKAVAEDNITIDEAEAYTPEAKYANVTLKRTFAEGWNGLVLPFDMTIDEAKAKFNATDVKDFAGITTSTEGTTLNFTDATEIKAGKPVMIKTSSTDTEYTIENAWLPGTELTGVSKENDDVKYTFTGTYAEENLAGKVFTLINGKYFYNYDGTESTVKAKSFRAYFLNETPETAAAKSKIIGFNLDGDTTGISEIKAGSKNDGKMFDMQGRRVLSPAKGLYIQNGKKVIVK